MIPDLPVGGAERVLVDLIRNLSPDRFEIALVSMYAPRHTPIEGELTALGVPIHFLNKHRGPDPRMLLRLHRVVQQFVPDIVHTHRYVLRYVVPLFLARRIPRLVHTVHSLVEKEAGGRPYWMIHLAYRRGAVPVAICDEVATGLLRRHGITECPIVPNGIPVGRFRAAAKARPSVRQKLGLTESTPICVSVGRLCPVKNHAMLLEAFAQAAEGKPEMTLLLVGQGPLKNRLADQAARLGLAKRVRFLGNRTDIPEILAAADVFVLASNWEGNPLVVMEAMAAGNAVLCTAVGGVPELVTDGTTGRLIAPGDVDAMANVMRELVEDTTQRKALGVKAAREADQRFDVSHMVTSYTALYEKLLQGREAGKLGLVEAKARASVTGTVRLRERPDLTDEQWDALVGS